MWQQFDTDNILNAFLSVDLGVIICSGAMMCSSCVVNDHFDSFNKVHYLTLTIYE